MSTVKLQVPIDKETRDKWESFASQNGFDSLQSYIRFIAKANIDGRRVDLDVDDWGQPSDKAAALLNAAAEKAKNDNDLSGPFTSVDDFMKDL